ncbi:Polysaccharide biosynthesis protein [Veillonella rodentium]|uniref:Polysaccharide biosynthesis protein n=2 Tax=Veillonella rodentium TaxID=248315 RepID=A0A239Y6Q5_9FIRM|nr:Polysaccharide biosynthesis protein [Veillonella rodentium]
MSIMDSMSSSNRSKERRVGVLLSYLFLLSNTVINLAYVPILIHYIGIDQFGLYKLLGSFIAYFGVLDFGLSATIVRFLVKYKVNGEVENINKLLSVAGLLYTGIGVIIASIGVYFYFLFPTLFPKLSTDLLNSGQIILLFLLFNILVLFSTKIFDAIIISDERFIFLKTCGIVQILIQPVFIVVAIIYYPYALTVVIVQTLTNVALVIAKYMYVKWYMGFTYSFTGWDSKVVKNISNLSLSFFVVSVVDQIFWQSNQLIIGAKLGSFYVAAYAIASQIYINYMNISLAISGVLLPKVTAMIATNASDNEITDVFIRVGRLQFYILSLILSGFIIFGHEFLYFWVGAKFDLVFEVVLIIISAFTIDLIQNLGLTIMQARNVYYIRAIVYTIVGVLNIALSYYWIPVYGIIGGAYSTALCMLIGNGFVMNYYYYRYMNINIVKFWLEIIKIAIIPCVLVPIMLYIKNYLYTQPSLSVWIVLIFIYVVLLLACYIKFSFNNYEHDLVYKVINKLK